MESGANTKEVLTPKNVYRFLTDNLPGLYPHGVIPVAERKGLTLVKFWAQVLDGIIPPEWHASLFWRYAALAAAERHDEPHGRAAASRPNCSRR